MILNRIASQGSIGKRTLIRIATAFVAAVLLAATAAAASPEESVTALKGGTILTMDGRTLSGGVILIEDGKITAVGRDVTIPAGARVIDAADGFVMPGLIDAITFFGVRPFRRNVAAPVTPENRIVDAYYPFGDFMSGRGGIVPEAELLCGGITTVYIAPGSGQLISGQGAVVKTAGTGYDEMILRESAAMDMTIAYQPAASGEWPSRMSTAALLRDTLFKARDFDRRLQAYRDKTDEEKKDAAPPARDLGNEALARMLRGEVPARIQADLVPDILSAVRIAEEFDLRLVIDGGLGAYRIRERLAEKGIPVVVGPLSHVASTATGGGMMELQVLENESNAALLHEAGVKVAIGSWSADYGGSGKNTQGRWLMLEAALASGFGMPPEAALKAITINAAEILGVADRVGSITPGKDADLIVLDGPPLSVETWVRMVLVNGRLVYERTADR